MIAAGKSAEVVPRLAREWNADRVLAHRWCEPFARERDRRVGEAARLVLYEGEMLLPPETLRTRAGTPHAVFTHFHGPVFQVIPFTTHVAPVLHTKLVTVQRAHHVAQRIYKTIHQ